MTELDRKVRLAQRRLWLNGWLRGLGWSTAIVLSGLALGGLVVLRVAPRPGPADRGAALVDRAIDGVPRVAQRVTARVQHGSLPAYLATMAATAALAAASCILLVGDIFPKIIVHLNPQRFSRLLAPPLVVCARLLAPVRMALGALLKIIFRVLIS